MSNPKYTEIFSHWNTMIEGLEASPKEFFKNVEYAINTKKVPDVKISRNDWREGGVFSAKREYLRVQRKELAFDIGAAPFGNGFFVSSWQGEIPSGFWILFAEIPVLGPLLVRMFRPATYYKIDTANMFNTLIHNAVLEVIDEFTDMQGLRKLADSERRPVMKSVFDK